MDRRHPGSHKPSQTWCTSSHLQRPHFRQRPIRTPRRPHAFAHSPPLLLTPSQSGRDRTCLQRRAPLARALSQALTPPRFPSPLVFLETALHSPPPRPEVLAVFLASLVSAPFPPSACLRPAPGAPRGTPPPPSPPSFQRGFPAAGGAPDFPAGYVGSGEESCPEVPPRPGPSWRGDRSRAAQSEERGWGLGLGSDEGLG